MHVLNALLHHGFLPKILKKERALLSIHLPDYKLRFIHFNSYMKNSLNDLRSLYKVPIPATYFPTIYHTTKMDEDTLPPTIDEIVKFEDSFAEVEEKKKYLETIKSDMKENHGKKLCNYLINRIRILTAVGTTYIKESLEFERKHFLAHEEKDVFMVHLPEEYLVHPFCSPCVGAPSFIFTFFRRKCFQMEKLSAVAKEWTGLKINKTSEWEMEYLKWIEYSKKVSLRHAFSSSQGQAYFKEGGFPDGLNEATGEAYQFYSCWLHGHLEDCPRNAGKDENRKVRGLTLVEKNERTKIMKEKLLSNETITSVEEMYTCKWSKLRAEGEVKDFLDNHFSKRPLDRLKPRVRWMFTSKNFHLINSLFLIFSGCIAGRAK